MAFSSLRKKSPSVSLVTTMFLLSMFLIHLFAWPYTRCMFNVWNKKEKKKKHCCFLHQHEIEPILLLPITYDGDTIYSILSAFQRVGFISLYQMLLQNNFFSLCLPILLLDEQMWLLKWNEHGIIPFYFSYTCSC
jgi:hypothetical protein